MSRPHKIKLDKGSVKRSKLTVASFKELADNVRRRTALSKCFKVGITTRLQQRCKEHQKGNDEGVTRWKKFVVLYRSKDSDTIRQLEKALIALFRAIPDTRNKVSNASTSSGGEGDLNGDFYYLYVLS